MSFYDDADSRYSSVDFALKTENKKLNSAVIRCNKLEIELEEAYLTISNLRGELGMWKVNTDTASQFFFFSEVAKLLKKYEDVVFIPDSFLEKYIHINRQNGIWAQIVNNPANITDLTKIDLLQAKRIVDSAKFTESVSASPFLKTYNILKGALSSLEIDSIEGKFYKYKFSHSHGKTMGVFIPKTISGRRDVEAAFAQSYGARIRDNSEHFETYITQLAYAQSLSFTNYIIKWQDFTLIEDALEKAKTIGKQEKDKAVEEISKFRRDSSYIRKQEKEIKREEKETKKEESAGEKVKKGEEKERTKGGETEKGLRHWATQTIGKESKSVETETRLTMDDVSELQSIVKRNVIEMKTLTAELKEANLSKGTLSATAKQLRIERESSAQLDNLRKIQFEQISKKEVEASLKVIYLQGLLDKINIENDDLRKQNNEKQETIETIPLMIDNATDALVRKCDHLEKEILAIKEDGETNIKLLTEDYAKLETAYNELFEKKPQRTEIGQDFIDLMAGIDEMDKRKEEQRSALKLLEIYSIRTQKILDLFHTTGSTLESISFLEDIVTRICEKEITSEVKHQTRNVTKLKEELNFTQQQLEKTTIKLKDFEASKINEPLTTELKRIFDDGLNKQVQDFKQSVAEMKDDVERLHKTWTHIKGKKKVIAMDQEPIIESPSSLNSEPKQEEGRQKKQQQHKGTEKMDKPRSVSAPRDRRMERIWVHLDQSEITFDDWYERCKTKPFLSNFECMPHDDRMCQGEWWMQKNVNLRIRSKKNR